jgi:23S rRNA G2445 N2-methylase RlmL
MKKFVFYAKSNPAFLSSLEKEFSHFGIEKCITLTKIRLNYIKFETTLPKVWNLFAYSRLLEDVKIEMAKGVSASSEKSFKICLKSIPFQQFLPIEKCQDYQLPKIKAMCFRSELFHEKMIEKITVNYLNKYANKEYFDNEKKLKVNEETVKDEERLRDLVEKRENLKELPRLDIVFQKDRGIFLLNMTTTPLYKHGYKIYKNWGTLRETYAAALIYESKILNNRDLYLWDPFCGSGTILIEALMILLKRPIRNYLTLKDEIFTELPFHDNKAFDVFLKEEKTISKKHEYDILLERDIHLLGSDIDSKSVDSFVKNCHFANLYKFKFREDEEKKLQREKSQIVVNPNIYHEKVNKIIDIFMGDFESIATNVVFKFDKKKFTIFSNIPYGESQEMAERVKIRSLYKRMGKFLRKYSNFVGDVFIIVKKRSKKDDLNFQNLTEMKWEVISTFFNNGIEVEFLQLNKTKIE